MIINGVFWAGVALIFVYELYQLDANKGETISEIIWRLCATRPLIPLVFGVLMGHFFWQNSSVYLGTCK